MAKNDERAPDSHTPLPADPWRENDEARRRRLREDGRRPLAVNLAEGLALSEFLSKFTGSARGS
jgi:hypothetical protein